ncbi:MAG: TetR/AcrR family transcriptional regulator [Candidatus Neoclostridium sp.]
MDYTPEEYTRYYLVQALFKLMSEYEYDKISVTDIAGKAGVGRATFYRYFKRKEDILIYYWEHNAKRFAFARRFYPRCKEDYVDTAKSVFAMFKKNKEPFKLIRKARLEYLYLDYLNKKFVESFENEHADASPYAPYVYAGMLFNTSMAWLDDDCREPVDSLAQLFVNSIGFA